MRVAVISDIHSNLLSFKLAIEDIKNNNIDKIIFLGDYITDGEDENEILNIIKEMSDYTIIGNREKYVLNYTPKNKDYNNYKTIACTYNNLSDDSINYIKSLNEYYLININNYKVLIIHGDTYISLDCDMDNVFDKLINDYDFDICLFGHTHKYLYKSYKDKIFINPGSIGQPVDSPYYKYCILDIDKYINVDLREFSISDTYDELEKYYTNTNYYKENVSWANLILLGIRDGRDYCSFFVESFKSIIRDVDNINVDLYNKIWDDAYNEYIKTIKK